MEGSGKRDNVWKTLSRLPGAWRYSANVCCCCHAIQGLAHHKSKIAMAVKGVSTRKHGPWAVSATDVSRGWAITTSYLERVFPSPFSPQDPNSARVSVLRKSPCPQGSHRYTPLCHPTQCPVFWASGLHVTSMPAAGRWPVDSREQCFQGGLTWIIFPDWLPCIFVAKQSLLDLLMSFIYLKGTNFY